MLRNTAASCDPSVLAVSGKPPSDICNKRELRIVQNQRHIAEPELGPLRCVTWEEFRGAQQPPQGQP